MLDKVQFVKPEEIEARRRAIIEENLGGRFAGRSRELDCRSAVFIHPQILIMRIIYIFRLRQEK